MSDFANSYWTVGGSTTHVYSSESNTLVPLSDDTYRDWSAANRTIPILSEDELWAVLQQRVGAGRFPAWLFDGTTFVQPSPATFTATQLITYANMKQWAVAVGGYAMEIEGALVSFDTSPNSMMLMNGKTARLSQPNPPEVVNWQVGPAEFRSIAAADFVVAATEIADWVQTTFDILPEIFAAIAAGTITTTAEIDAAFA